MSNRIIKYGRYMKGGQTSALVVSKNGIAPCVLENHGKVTAILERKETMLENVYDVYNDKMRTDKCSGVITTAHSEKGSGVQYVFEETGKVKELGYMEHGTGQHQSNTVYDTNGITPAITTIQGGGTQQIKIMEEPRCNVVGSLDTSFESTGRVYSPTGISPCLNTCGGGNLQPKIIDEQNMCIREDGCIGTLTTDGSSPKHNNRIAIRQATEQGYIECELGGVADFSFPNSKNRRGRVQNGGKCRTTLTSGGIDGLHRIESRYRIRKLTPRECWRLMAFTDEEFDKAEKVNSNTNLYKQAGNSIVVDVLVALFQEIINADGTINDHKGEQINLFDLL